MNKITTDIITTTGINISKYDILPSKVFINGIEITDTGTWNKVISSIDVKDKEIDRLNNVINELEKTLEYEKNDYGGNIDIETHNIDSEFLRGNSWEADYILNKLKELKENRDER